MGKVVGLYIPKHEIELFQWLIEWLPEQDAKTQAIMEKHLQRTPERAKRYRRYCIRVLGKKIEAQRLEA